MKPVPRQLAGLLLMGAGLALTTLALVMLWLAPEVFVATARVLLPPEPSAPQPLTAATQTAGGAAWTPNEVERIHAKAVLHQVITNLDLQKKWAEQFKEEGPLTIDRAYQLLKEQMDVRQPGNASLIVIRIMSYDGTEAANIANRIAEVYRDARRADGAVVQIVESAQPPPKGRRSGGANALGLFLAGVAGLGGGYWVLRSAGLLGPAPPAA
jgi:uncharacterized protein involved in exopolysaccharide biosynthesis